MYRALTEMIDRGGRRAVITHRTVAGLRAALEPLRAGSRIGLVPTMGALHAGHEALIRRAREECDVVVASIFVNPAQFGATRGPRPLPPRRGARRRARRRLGRRPPLRPVGAGDVPARVPDLGRRRGASARTSRAPGRPGHFRGVATVCLKLFNIVEPDVAYFGRKDAQQAALVDRMVRDLDLELEIRVVPTVRDEDGVAVSSRNVYLSAGRARGRAGAARARSRPARRRTGETRTPPRPPEPSSPSEPLLDAGVRRGCAPGRPRLPSGCGARGAHPADRQRRPRRRS